ncbi:MAG: hypothetical protein IJ519_05240 [Clostridia bacterium]|nr:hypothetical protein [Clostridia bacterium]
MKKLLALLLAIIMVFTLCACGEGKKKDKDDDTTEATNATEPQGTVADPDGSDEPEGGVALSMPYKNVTMDMNMQVAGQQMPAKALVDLENLACIYTFGDEAQAATVAVDSEGVYILVEENGQVVAAQQQSFADMYSQYIPGYGSSMPEISPDELAALSGELQKIVGMLDGSTEFDLETVVGILESAGIELPLEELLTEMGITAQQAEDAVKAVLELLNDEQWLAKSFKVENTIVNGTGTISLESELSTVIYDVMAAVSGAVGEEVPTYDESGFASMPLSVSLTLKDSIPTALNLSYGPADEGISLAVTNVIDSDSIDFDAKFTAYGEEYALAIDAAVVGNAITLTADITAEGQTVRVLDFSFTLGTDKAVLIMTAGMPDNQVKIECEATLANGKVSGMKMTCDVFGEVITADATFSGYDSTKVDLTSIKAQTAAYADNADGTDNTDISVDVKA